MEILIMQRNYVLGGYKDIFHDNVQMAHLGQFLDEIDPLKALNWIQNPVSSGTEKIEFCVENNNVEIYFNQFYLTPEQSNYYYENKFTINFHEFIKILEKWKELTSNEPEFVIIKKTNDDIFLEADFREKTYLNLENIIFPSISIQNLFEPKIINGLFYGGLHIESKTNNYKPTNKLIDHRDIKSFDIKFENDFTFNHSFFPENINIENFEKNLTNSFKDTKATKYKNITNFHGKNCNFFISIFTFGLLPPSMAIYNKKLELISCCPIFRRIK